MTAALRHLESLGTDCQGCYRACVASETRSAAMLVAVLFDCGWLFQPPAGVHWQPLEILLCD